jgi:hypothetical protein
METTALTPDACLQYADRCALLMKLNEAAGLQFGTEQFSFFLYSVVRMQVPEVIVELGTGLGISAFWMALGAQANKSGHVWTVDDFQWFARRPRRANEIASKLREADVVSLESPTAEQFYSSISRRFELDEYLTFVKGTIELNEAGHFDRYSFAGRPIDLLFSDFKHGPLQVMRILGHFLPRMAPSSSIFIHSASTSWSSYLLLEQICSHINAGRVPKSIQDLCTVDLQEVMRNRRIVLVHLTERRERKQNSAAWLKIEPVDVFPQPPTLMRK